MSIAHTNLGAKFEGGGTWFPGHHIPYSDRTALDGLELLFLDHAIRDRNESRTILAEGGATSEPIVFEGVDRAPGAQVPNLDLLVFRYLSDLHSIRLPEFLSVKMCDYPPTIRADDRLAVLAAVLEGKLQFPG